MNTIKALLLVIVATAILGIFLLLWGALAVGTANAWILEGTFSDGWHAVWDRWLQALGWSVLWFGVLGGGGSAVSKSKN